MKKNIVIIGLIGILMNILIFTSCSPDYETEFEVKTLVVPDNSLSPISFPMEGGEKRSIVDTNVELANWSASSNADWLIVDKSEGEVTISAGRNDTFAPRVAVVTIEYGYQIYSINIYQAGNTPILLIDGERTGTVKSVNPSESIISIHVNTNMILDNILIPDTANFVYFVGISDVIGSEDEKILSFKIDQNMSPNRRYCNITLQSSDNYSYTSSFLVVQSEIIFEEIPLRVDMLYSNAPEYYEGPLANILDNDPSTYFHSAYSYNINDYHYIQISLDEPIPGCVFWYRNRGNSNGKPTEVSIMVSADNEVWEEMAYINSGLPIGPSDEYESIYYASEKEFKYFRFVVKKTNADIVSWQDIFFNMADFKLYRPLN